MSDDPAIPDAELPRGSAWKVLRWTDVDPQ